MLTENYMKNEPPESIGKDAWKGRKRESKLYIFCFEQFHLFIIYDFFKN